jgi:hypothetical protein
MTQSSSCSCPSVHSLAGSATRTTTDPSASHTVTIMGLKGEDISEALRDWIKSDVSEIGKTSYDIGKFLFTIASGSIGILASLQKLDAGFKPTGWTLSPYGLFTVALLLALNLVLPRNRKVGGDTDLHDLHAKEVRFVTQRIWFWFVAWFFAVLLSLWTLLPRP